MCTRILAVMTQHKPATVEDSRGNSRRKTLMQRYGGRTACAKASGLPLYRDRKPLVVTLI